MPDYSEKQLDELISRSYKTIAKDVEHLPAQKAWERLAKELPKATLKKSRWQLPLVKVAAVVLCFAVITGAFTVLFPGPAKDIRLSMLSEKGNNNADSLPEGVMSRKMADQVDASGYTVRDVAAGAAGDTAGVMLFSGSAPISAPAENGVELSIDGMTMRTESEGEGEPQNVLCKKELTHEEEVTLEQAIAKAPFKIRIPGYLPENLVLDRVLFNSTGPEVNSKNATATVTLLYSSVNEETDDEFLCITLQNFIDEPVSNYLAKEDNPRADEIEVNGGKGKLTTVEDGFTNLFWVLQNDRVVVNLDGKLTDEEILKIANSMQP